VFVRSGTAWTQEAKLVASDGAASDYFGVSVSINGDSIVVGAYLDDDKGDGSGSAYVFVRSGTAWTQEAKLVASDGAAYDSFGKSVSINGDSIVVGAYLDDDKSDGSGSAYVFIRVGTVWIRIAKFFPNDGERNDYFGCSVSIGGDTIVVGAYGDDDKGVDSGSAYFYGALWVSLFFLLLRL
ncbi:hypothetical protein ACHAXS_000044, partial [Conticribra weissflogii]